MKSVETNAAQLNVAELNVAEPNVAELKNDENDEQKVNFLDFGEKKLTNTVCVLM